MRIRRRNLAVLSWVLVALLIVLLIRLLIGDPTSADSTGTAQTGRIRWSIATRFSTPTPTPTPSMPGAAPHAPATGSGTGTGVGVGSGSGGASVNQPAPNYTIGGALAQQLRPGDQYPLDLTLTNLGGVAMTADNLLVTVSSVAAPNASTSRPCPVSDFQVVQVATGFSVALGPHESTSLSARGIPSSQWPQLGMLNTSANQDGCKGATLNLTFSGTVGP